MKKTLSIILSMVLMLSLLFQSIPALAEEATFPQTVTDAAGREVTLDQAPEKIVSGYYIATSMLIALGIEDHLVGIEAKANSRLIYALAAPQLLDLPSVGTAKQFDLEGALTLEPDLVVLPLKLSDTAQILEEMGVKVVLVNPESWDELLDTARLLSIATGTSADLLLDWYTKAQEKLETILEGKDTPSVYLAGNSSYLSTAGSKMYQDTLLTMGGGVNVASSLPDAYWAEISYEQLLAWNPDVIIVASDAGYTVDDLLADAQLQSLNAVQNGQVFAMPSSPEAFDSPVPGAILGSLWMTSTLHSDVYSREAFYADAHDFYETFYQVEVTEDTLN